MAPILKQVRPVFFLLFFALPVFPRSVWGVQDTPTIENQVPISQEAGIIEISPTVRERLGLFSEVDGFTGARLFLQPGGATLLEVESRVGGQLRRERRILSQTELQEFRTLIATRLEEGGESVAFTRDGRGRLVLSQTLLGLGFYGWAVPVILDLDEAQAAVGTYLVTAGAAFYLPYRLTRNRSVSRAHSDLTFYGSTRGTLVGTLLSDALISEGAANEGRKRLTGALVGSIGGSILGFAAVNHFNPSESSTSLWGTIGDFGFLGGATLAHLLGPYDSEEITYQDGDFVYVQSELKNPAAGHLLTVAGGAVGLYLGSRMGGPNFTEGNVGALRSGGILGAQVGLTLAQALGLETERREGDLVLIEDETRALAAGALLGGITGLYLGDRYLEGKRYTVGEGLLINAGHLAGAATALGLTYLITEEIDEEDALLYLSASTVGSLLGAGIVVRTLGVGTETLATTNGQDLPRRQGRGGVTVALHPENLVMGSIRRSEEPPRPLPLLQIRF